MPRQSQRASVPGLGGSANSKHNSCCGTQPRLWSTTTAADHRPVGGAQPRVPSATITANGSGGRAAQSPSVLAGAGWKRRKQRHKASLWPRGIIAGARCFHGRGAHPRPRATALQAGVDIVLATAVVLVVAASGGAVVITVDVASLQDRRSSPSVVGRAPLIDARRRSQWRQ